MDRCLRTKFHQLDWSKYGSGALDELFDRNNRYGIKIDLDKKSCEEILNEVLKKDRIQDSCICGGFFTEPTADRTADIFVFDGGKSFLNNQEYLNSFLNEPYQTIDFEELGKIAPSGVEAMKKLRLKNGQKVCLYFTHLPFPKDDLYKYQLLDLFDLEPSKIMFYGGNKQFYLNNWFSIGGNIIPGNKSPTKDFVNKYRNKGFDFEGDYFFPRKNFL